MSLLYDYKTETGVTTLLSPKSGHSTSHLPQWRAIDFGKELYESLTVSLYIYNPCGSFCLLYICG
jgi:hypothetical protein